MNGASDSLHASRIPTMVVFAATLLTGSFHPASGKAADLAVTPLFDGEHGDLCNTWGGTWDVGTMHDISVQPDAVHTGRRTLCVEFRDVAAGQACHFSCRASGSDRPGANCQTRNLTRYERLKFRVRNGTAVALHGMLQIKDYRDTAAHRASYRFELPGVAEWMPIDVPLALSSAGWTLEGQPDLSRVLTIDFQLQSEAAVPGGRIYLDDVVLVEPNGPVDIDTAPMALLVQRLAQRQWDALWSARSRDHGLVPNHSYQTIDAGLNITAAVLWMLPTAVRHHWVEQKEADQYAAQLVETLDRLLDRAVHLPPRSVDWVTLKPSIQEESTVDAAFLALALHQYKSQPATSTALRESLDRVQERFDFAPFVCAGGWCMAYRYATPHSPEGLISLTYNGYTNEAKVISLAAHLSKRSHVPIETCWNTDVHRVREQLVRLDRAPVVHSLCEFRSPFTQALLNLFVDVQHRGVDKYPDDRLATNPWQNFVCYEQCVMARLAELGRPYLAQPDAGDDGTLSNYQQYSLYQDFGQGDLFMPWSAAFALQARADGAEASLRFLLRHRLHGPLGLADSVKWKTGEPRPYAVTPRHDFWNTAISTMALLEWLDGDARSSTSFANLTEVREALDRVFIPLERHAARPTMLAAKEE